MRYARGRADVDVDLGTVPDFDSPKEWTKDGKDGRTDGRKVGATAGVKSSTLLAMCFRGFMVRECQDALFLCLCMASFAVPTNCRETNPKWYVRY